MVKCSEEVGHRNVFLYDAVCSNCVSRYSTFYIGAIAGIKLRKTAYAADKIKRIYIILTFILQGIIFMPNTFKTNPIYIIARIISPKTIKAFCRSDNKTSPCKSAITARVIPQPGQYIPNNSYKRHGGKVKLRAAKTAE